ncbi:hypothetical protein HDV63DRAFT_371031 [Trichoderma sp. SZMC 28014]
MAGNTLFKALVLAALGFTTSATQVNVYHDLNCAQYAYTVYSSNWQCQDINGVKGIDMVNSNAQCNTYKDTNCQEYIAGASNKPNTCLIAPGSIFSPNGGGEPFGSVACNS